MTTRMPPTSVQQKSYETSTSSKEIPSAIISPITKDDFAEWSRLFQGYLEFYKTSLPQTQYQNTFSRLVDKTNDLSGLVLRDNGGEKRLLGIAHYFPHQTPWNEKQILHLNGMYRTFTLF